MQLIHWKLIVSTANECGRNKEKRKPSHTHKNQALQEMYQIQLKAGFIKPGLKYTQNNSSVTNWTIY